MSVAFYSSQDLSAAYGRQISNCSDLLDLEILRYSKIGIDDVLRNWEHPRTLAPLLPILDCQDGGGEGRRRLLGRRAMADFAGALAARATIDRLVDPAAAARAIREE